MYSQVAVNEHICIGRPDNDIGRLISLAPETINLDIIPANVYTELMASVDPTEIYQLMA